MVLKFTANLSCGYKRDDETSLFVSSCPALQLCTQGRNEVESKQALESAITLFLTICFEYSILDKVLKERGFTAMAGTNFSAISAGQAADSIKVEHLNFDETFDVEVPMFLVAQQHGENAQCRPQ